MLYAAFYFAGREFAETGTGLSPEQNGTIVKCILFLVLIVSWTGVSKLGGFVMLPSERYWLFSGPYSLRQISWHRMVTGFRGVATIAIVVAPLVAQFGPSAVCVVTGFLLYALFLWCLLCLLVSVDVKLDNQCARSLPSMWALRIFRSLRVVLALALVAVMLFPIFAAIRDAHIHQSFRELESIDFTMLFLQPAATPGFRQIMMIFDPFLRIMSADALDTGVLGWMLVAVAMSAVSAALVLLINTDYRQAVVEASIRYLEFLEQQSGGIKTISKRRRGRIGSYALPFGPVRGCFGAIMWQSLASAVRRANAVLFVVPLGAVVFLYAAKLLLPSGLEGGGELEDVIIGPLFIFVFAPLIVMQGISGKFENLQVRSVKTLPAPPLTVIAAMALGSTLVTLWVFAWIALGCAAFLNAPRVLFPTFFVLPVAVFAENLRILLVHLLVGARRTNSPAAEVMDIAYGAYSGLLHLATCLPYLILAVPAGYFAWRLSNHSLVVTLVTLSLVSVLLACIYLFSAAYRFSRLDPRSEIAP
ncbi:MAG: hypothetical protein K1Y02_25030 [Candidatus Hydrogenedentes bacterium]|nr:hypothetical protein [Candidatus Hydrogenedentota bacterium]